MSTIERPDDAAVALHSSLAKLYFDAQKQHQALVAKQAGEVPAEIQRSLSQASATEYKPVQTAFGGLFLMTISTTIVDGNGKHYLFNGLGGGVGFGGSLSWGAAWLNYPLSLLNGWEFRFEANLSPSVVNVQWWGMSGEYIGSFVGAGVSIAAGAFGGKGKITS